MRKWIHWKLCKVVQPLWKENTGSCFKSYLPCELDISLLCAHLRERKIHLHTQTCTQIFIAELFIMAKVEAALMASTDEWINKKQYIYTTEYYLTIKGIKY